MKTQTPAPLPVAEKQYKARKHSFFYGGRQDSPFKRILIHLALILACVASAYPVLRILSVALRPGNRLLSTDLSIIPAGATLESFRIILFEKPFLQWIWNSLAITVATAIIGVILARSWHFCSPFLLPRSFGRSNLLVDDPDDSSDHVDRSPVYPGCSTGSGRKLSRFGHRVCSDSGAIQHLDFQRLLRYYSI